MWLGYRNLPAHNHSLHFQGFSSSPWSHYRGATIPWNWKKEFACGRKIEEPGRTREMGKEKSPGLKILWLWTLGTAAILVTSVVKTRLRDMEQMMNADQHQQQELGSSSCGDLEVMGGSREPEEGIILEPKS